MSSIGRIFIVLNLGLAALCLGWASNHLGTSEDYKAQLAQKSADMETAIADKDTEIRTFQGARSKAENELADKRTENAGLQTLNTQLEKERDAAIQAKADLEERVVKFENSLDSLSTTQNNLQSLYEQADSDKEAALSAKRDAEDAQAEAIAKQRDAENKLRQANNMIASLEVDKTAQAKDIEDLQVQIEVLQEVTGVPAATLLSMPLIDGAIVGINTDIQPGLVAINKGTDDGVHRGFTFDIYRGGIYKGRVRVETVQANMCTAVILKTYEGRTIAQGDSAATRL